MAMLATLDDVAAVGGIPVDVAEESSEAVRATRLLELVSGAVLVLLEGFDITEANVTDDWSEPRRDALAGIVAEIASKRLNVSAAASVDPYGVPNAGPMTLKLNRWEKRAILDICPLEDFDDDETPTGATGWFEP